MTDNTDNNNNSAPKTSNVVSAMQTIFGRLKNWSLHRSEFSDAGAWPPCWTCTKLLLHLRLLNPTKARLQNKLMLGSMQTRYAVTPYSVCYLMICSISIALKRKKNIFGIPLSSNTLPKTSSDKASRSETTTARRWLKTKTLKSR